MKQKFGPWMLPVFRALASLKALRGSPLDIFGYSAERKMERALPMAYRATISALLSQLTPGNLAQVVAVASIPEDIRGYGHVKQRHLALAHARQCQLLADVEAISAQKTA